MGRVWAVARYTLAQCLRTKVAAVFIVLLAGALVALPFTLKGDGTLAGQIRTFLAYSTSATAVLLSLVTILLGVGVVAGDVKGKHVFLLASKPVGRSQYILGRWLGIVLLNAILLAIAGAAVYGTAQHLRRGEAPELTDPEARRRDRLAVENEVFASRAKISPEPATAEQERRMSAELQRLGESGLQEAVKAQMAEAGQSEQEARDAILAAIAKRVREGIQSIGPYQQRRWTFKGVRPVGEAARGAATVSRRLEEVHLLLRPTGKLRDLWEARKAEGRPARVFNDVWINDRFAAREHPEGFETALFSAQAGQFAAAGLVGGRTADIRATFKSGRDELSVRGTGEVSRTWTELRVILEPEKALMDRLMRGLYVSVNGVDGRVDDIRPGEHPLVTVRFFEEGAQRAEVSALAPGAQASLLVHPMLELSYQVSGSRAGGREWAWGQWRAFGDDPRFPDHTEWRQDPIKQVVRWRIPGRIVGPDGTMWVEYTNWSPDVVSVLHDDVALFYRVGSFEMNFVRALLLILVQVMFLAGVAVFAASFMTFPVACLASFAVLPFALAREFLAASVKLPSTSPLTTSPLTALGHGVYRIMQVLTPDFADTMPGADLVDALHIGWGFVGEIAAVTVVLRTGLLLLLACLIYRYRELARVQV